MQDWEIEYEKEQQIKNKLAEKIWDNPFHSGLSKFTKKELLLLINEIENRIGWEYEENWHELDIKDLVFEEKCWLIETLNPNFFKEKSEKQNKERI